MRGVLLLALAACSSAGGIGQQGLPGPGGGGVGSDTVEVLIAATTDVHGRLRGWDYYSGRPETERGLARAATIVDSLRRAHTGRVVLVDAGDFLQGNPLAYYAARIDTAARHPVIAAMNAMSYDAAAVGNHEFNYGLETLRGAARQAAFPLLAANAWLPNGSRAFPASVVVNRAGLRIAVVGATNPGSMIWDRANLEGRLQVRDIVADVRGAVAAVRRQGVDVVVVVLHSGLDEPPSYDTAATGGGLPAENVAARVAREVSGIDVVVYGHSHREQAGLTSGSTLLIQPRNWATSVAVATLRVARGAGGGVVQRRGALIQAAGRAEDPTVVASISAAHEATLRYVARPLGSTPVPWRADSARVMDTPLIDFVNEVQRRRAGADLSSTAAFALNASLDSGAVTIAHLARLYPYENTLRAVRISGRQLRAYLEHSARYYRSLGTPSIVDPGVPGYNFDIVAGATYTLDLSRPVGARVTALTFRGRPVAETDSFTLALNNYRQGGGGGYAMLRGAPVVYDRQEDVRELLMDEVRTRGTLRPEDYFIASWRLEPPAAVAQAAAELAPPGKSSAVATGAVSGTDRDAHLGNGRWLRIMATNDFHGALDPRADSAGVLRGGAAYLAAELRAAERSCTAPACRSIYVDGGDMFQGTAASNFAYGRPVVDVLNSLGLAAAALGNHEFDWGIDTLRARMRDARYAILGANVRDTTGRDIPWIRDDTLVTRGGLRIGIVGIALVATPTTTKAAAVRGLRFVDPVAVIEERARSLRGRGATHVVVVAHSGAFCGRELTSCRGEITDVAQRLSEPVDAIVSGHTHSPVRALVRGVPIVQARSRGSALGIIDIPLGNRVGEPVIQLRDVRADAIAADTAIASLVRSAGARVGESMSVPVAEIAEHIGLGLRGPLGGLIADAQRKAGEGDIAIMNNGGIRAPIPAGHATVGSLYEVHPFGNRLVRLTVTGRDLRSELERQLALGSFNLHLSGVHLSADSARPVGSRVVSLTRDGGSAVEEGRSYSVILSDFLADGGDRVRLAGTALRREDLEVLDHDALIAYLKSLPQPVRVHRVERVRYVR